MVEVPPATPDLNQEKVEALIHAAKQALQLLEDFEVSGNPVTKPEHFQSTGFFAVRASLAEALMALGADESNP